MPLPVIRGFQALAMECHRGEMADSGCLGTTPLVGMRANVNRVFVNLGVRGPVSLEDQPQMVLSAALGLGQD